jgi:RNA polymerase sigma factor (sigma-70 family)
MGNRQRPAVLRCIRKLVSAEPAGDVIDRELLQRFAMGREEPAFEALVQRHGRMVLGVCRRVLHDRHDADDAFQATFLVLMRKAGSLDRRGSLAGWLYTVAYHLALKARACALRRRVRERQIEDALAAESPADSIWWELRPILDEEVNRLPEKYRAPIVLCYLEGKTNEEAARQLGCPFGTVSSRLARARDLLRTRLTRRGLALSSGVFVAALTQGAASATVPSALVQATFQTALTFTTKPGPGKLATSAAVLADGMLKAMHAGRLKIAAVVGLSMAAVGVVSAALIYGARTGSPTDDPPAPQVRYASAPGKEAPDPECPDDTRSGRGSGVIARPEAFPTLVGPVDCSHCRNEAQRRAGDLRADDRVLSWIRGPYDGGAIPLRFFLNSHRVISDKYGVFVYDPDAGFARGFAPSLEFRFHGWRNGIMVMRRTDGTLYSSLSGRAFDGPRKGERLQPLPTLVSDWGFWLPAYPGTSAYTMFDKYQPVELPTRVHHDSCTSRGPFDKRLASTTPVLGVVEGTHARAYPLDLLARAGLLRDVVDGQPRVLLWFGPTRTAAAYRPVASPPGGDAQPPLPVTLELDRPGTAAPFSDKETGSRWDVTGRAVEGERKGWTLTWLDGVQVKWFAWAAEHPETSIFGQ